MDMVSDVRLAQEKQKYQQRIIRNCQDHNKTRPLNVAIIGPPGVGKSSLVNTIAASFSDDTWREYAYSGCHGDASQITVFTKSFPKCCHGLNAKYSNVNLPTLIDIAGLTDEERERYVELLRIVFYGRLPEEESLAEADEFYKKHGIEDLRQKYAENDEKLKVDRIIFVSSATQEVPQNLIGCVLRAARPSGVIDSRKRTIPVYGVLTKQDKVGSGVLTKEDYDKREKQFIDALGLAGSLHRLLRCRNYCDDVDHGQRTDTVLPELDLPALKFMTQVSDPVFDVINERESYAAHENKAESEILRRRQTPSANDQSKPSTRTHSRAGRWARGRANRSPERGGGSILDELGVSHDQAFYIMVAIEAVLLAVILMFLMRPPVDMGKLQGACNYMKTHDQSIEAATMRDICDNLGSNYSGFFMFLTALAFVGIRFGVKYGYEQLQQIQIDT
ncbi:uncharacterized protein LOC124122915 [Haliotis rufescens]|uniref:uncharacterized protein LOC124122915 n=1 Tax=Haliotis rufescens TaxID=6454 RepID=UPI00201F0474|nr:uncharacterized protein LOC124122915 [Haliotis rufescens]XP_046342067.2 uncharacterized protein LOC124122915 [Haliotis rufescens]